MSLALQLILQQPSRWSVAKQENKTRICWSSCCLERRRLGIHISNDGKFNLLVSDGRQFVIRFASNKLNSKCAKKSVKFERGSIMFWGAFSSEGVGPLVWITGTEHAKVYFNLVEQHATPSPETSPNQRAIFIQNNAPCHTAKRV